MTNNLSMLAAMAGVLLSTERSTRRGIRTNPTKRKAKNGTKRKPGFKAKKKGRSR